LLAPIALLALLYLARQAWLPALARWLDVGEEPQLGEYDCAMVLSGEDNVRPFAGAALYKTGFVRHVLLANIAPQPGADPVFSPPGHDVSRRILLLRGVSASDIQVTGEPCESTFDEAQVLAGVLDESPGLRVLVVTSDCHTRRARWIFHRVLGARAAQTTFVSVPVESVPPDRWWRSEVGFLVITSEYVKLLLYGFRYGNLGYWTAGSIVGLLGAYLAVRYIRGWGRRTESSGCMGNTVGASSAPTCGTGQLACPSDKADYNQI
jgi:uncharacterized SAM-binding protein YcdF (DUF218 family)